jgi:hypothetical protein
MSVALVLATALAAAGQNASTAGSDQAIIVEGVRNQKRRASDFVNKILPPIMDAQLGRFEDPLCPTVIGLPEKLRDEVIARMRLVTAATKVAMASGRCTPNLVLIVVPDKRALIEGMRREKRAYLYGVGADRVHQMENSRSPVAAWQISDIVGADGMPLRVDGDGFPRLFTTVPPSRMSDSTRSRLLAGIVVVETRGLLNVSTRQLADYALMRTLTPMEAREREAPASSVLSLFNDGVKPADAPQSVTVWDVALLEALAETRSDLNADLQRAELRDKIVRGVARIEAQQPH